MKLPSYLAKSRHGIYYFRLTFRSGFTTKEKRISLRTKNPQEARFKASCLSGIMAVQKREQHKAMDEVYTNAAASIAGPDSDFLLNLLHRVDRQQLAELAGLPMSAVNELFASPQPDVRKLDIEMPGGVVLRNINSDEDMNRAVHILRTLNLTPESLAKLITSNPNPVSAPVPIPQPAAPTTEEGGTTIQEMVPRFATRKRNKLAPKSLYEYGNYQQKFVDWLVARKKNKHIPIHSITRADVADYIEDLQHEGLKDSTITNKCLRPINGLFELAQTMGILPAGPLATSGHKVFTKADAKKAAATTGYKPFTDDELKAIFKLELLTKAQRPADFWLPMLGLFTGGRIAELCQLDVADIQQHGGIWAISINSDGDKSLKSLAARRIIPVHQTLIDCGFLDYVKDASRHGTKLFPYLTADPFGNYSGTPSERWGKYLDLLN